VGSRGYWNLRDYDSGFAGNRNITIPAFISGVFYRGSSNGHGRGNRMGYLHRVTHGRLRDRYRFRNRYRGRNLYRGDLHRGYRLRRHRERRGYRGNISRYGGVIPPVISREGLPRNACRYFTRDLHGRQRGTLPLDRGRFPYRYILHREALVIGGHRWRSYSREQDSAIKHVTHRRV
jgi:hypothetical protein